MSLRSRLLLAIAYPLFVAIVALAVPLTVNLHDRVEAEVREQASAQALLLAASVPELDDAALGRLVRQGGERTGGRVVVVDGRGAVIADSAGPQTAGENYADRPEIAAALDGKRFQQERRSDTLDTQLLATAVPVLRAGRATGAVRVTQDVRAVGEATRRATTGIGAVSAVVLIVGLVLAAVLAAQLARPSRQLQAAAERLAHGDLDARAPVTGAKEQRRMAAAFNDMAVRLGRLLDGQRAFVADASHQLRTPLTGMRLRLEELRHAPDAATAREDADAALAELDRLARTVDELLILSQAGEPDAPAERLDLVAELAETHDRWSAAAEARGATLVLAESVDVAPGRAAAADLQRALDVLVENALAYGGPGVTVTLRAVPGAVTVTDDGPGPEAGEEEDVFERFHRGSAGRAGGASTPGTGLGLAIARELAHRWGGRASLGRGPDGGAVATLEVPS